MSEEDGSGYVTYDFEADSSDSEADITVFPSGEV